MLHLRHYSIAESLVCNMKAKEHSEKMVPRQNIKSSKLLIKDTVISLRTDNENGGYLLSLGSMVNSKGNSNQEICHRLAIGKVTMKVFERIFKCSDESLHLPRSDWC